jgi:peptidase E
MAFDDAARCMLARRQGRHMPTVLLADSQLLFGADRTGARFLVRLRGLIAAEEPRAAYLGAANGDRAEFYEMFRAAMESVGVSRCRHVPAAPSAVDRAFLEEADLILLAGGHVGRGLEAMTRAGLAETLVRRGEGGALLVGISAGAVHLGLSGHADEDGSGPPLDLLGRVPFAVDAHAEPEWARLRRLVRARVPRVAGLGVPTGGGAILHSDGAVEAVLRPVLLLTWHADELQERLAAPPAATAPRRPGAAPPPRDTARGRPR